MLVLIAGLPGTGKTTIARTFAAMSGAVHLNSDVLRKDLGLMGQYNEKEKQLVYKALLKCTEDGLKEGKTVVVDSTFYLRSIREPFEFLAKTIDIPLIWVEIKAAERILQERLQKPRPDSEADFFVYEKIRDQFEPLEEPHLCINSGLETPESAAKKILQYLT
ncbi:MAG: AAA family ATPase [Saprospiraceae bacterium]|nr:AAA family ATPase [Saprospiraceae bacterium]